MSKQIIDQAISENKDIEFNYTKYSGETSKRRISNIKYSNEYGEYGFHNDHIKGYCNLRNEDRTFKISRMSNIKLSSALNSNLKSVQTSYLPPKPAYSTPPIYKTPQPNYNFTQQTKQKEGCYIATMVYGDYNDHRVLILRNYRDNKLSKHKFGRVFIRTYYTLSPILVEKLKNKKAANYLIRLCLNNLINLFKTH